VRKRLQPILFKASHLLSVCGCLLMAGLAVHGGTPPTVSKVEPPSWWARHTINPVRLLVHGDHLSGARVSATRSQIQVRDVRVSPSGTWLFVSVQISATARPGSYPLTVRTSQGRTTIPFSIGTALDPRTNFQGISAADVIYLIMIDRFANGDESNDAPADAPAAANDRRNPRAFHGGDLQGVIGHLPYLKDLGVTALWLTPWYDNWNGVHNCDRPWCPNTSYHGYGAIDYYAVEDHFGTMEKLQELVATAHRLGLKVIQDQVANHVSIHHPWITDPPLGDWFHGTAAYHQRNRFENSALLSPHANSDAVRNTLDGWFSDDLPDLNQEQPEVARYEIQNALWWVGMTGIDGIRQDTIQYLSRPFIRQLADALHRQYPRLWMVGEVFERDAAQTAFFIGGHQGWDGLDTHLDSVFDFSLWSVSLRVFTGRLPVRALRDQLKYDGLYPDPNRVTTLVNNHDTPRFASLEGGSLAGAKLHTAFTLSVRGIPQLYAGEEIAMPGKEDPDNRRDFPGGFQGDPRNAFSAAGRTPEEEAMHSWTRSWVQLRNDHLALRQGKLIDLSYDNDAYVFARQTKSETLVIAINRSQQARLISVSAAVLGFADGARLVSLVGEKHDAAPAANGEIMLPLPGSSAVAYRLVAGH
jgi:neopullulanase